MRFKEKNLAYRKIIPVEIQEEKVQETIRKSKEAFFLSEQKRLLSFHEFIWSQFRLIKYRWWVCQLAVLFLLWTILVSVQEDYYIQRSMGIIASLFVILIMPEMWKNRMYQSMEIESSTYYSLRRIYAARMILFGAADTLFLTLFIGLTVSFLDVAITDLLIQFLFPMTITACVCFRALSSKQINEAGAVTLCVLWSAIWLLVILNEAIYRWITVPVWIGLLAAALLYLGIAVYRVLKSCFMYWEVSADGIKTQ
ncbi:MAG: hypothetical protein ACLTTZ_09395 [Lachnospiraceae bacterium]